MILPKLVRNKIPEIIEKSGQPFSVRLAKESELNSFLIRKMVEEVSEFEEKPSVEEAADIYEVFLAILENWHIKIDDVQKEAFSKKSIRGSFSEGIILERVGEHG